MLVEDNAVNQKVAMNILQNLGFRADAVSNGKEAVRALEKQAYDLVLMDCQMPEMDGYEATRCIRSETSRVLNREVPIIAMTAHAMSGDREKCLGCGMDDYISKPVEPIILNQTIEKWMNRAASTPKAAFPDFSEQPASSVFDKEGLVSRMLDDLELVKDVLDTYLQDTPEQIRLLRLALEGGDMATASLKAHTLAGASSNVGAMAVQKTAQKIEIATRESALEKGRELSKKLERETDDFRKAVKQSGLMG